ncbi:Calcium-independent phospholipase A2-gamma [Leucoagaricus sp. SymC.cos]|nr:Calcium-independent phospholipase A2-gamma [Leucoagaricus sp. SymC.cos]
MTIVELAKSTDSCFIEAEDSQTISRIWFKSKPIDRNFCYRVVQLQLLTDSCDQGYTQADTLNPGSWSWFEVVILPDENSDIPRNKDGKELVWRSHGNRSDSQDVARSPSRFFGKVFDRREEILDSLEVGNVIAVRACVRYPGWINDARNGCLSAKLLSEDIFSPMSWTLGSVLAPNIPDQFENGVFTLVSRTGAHIQASNSEVASFIWFTTPVLDKFIADKIQDVQLFTVAHRQETVSDNVEDKWSWFDLAILDNPEATAPRMKNGRSLVWQSHNVSTNPDNTKLEQGGKLFTSQNDIIKLLEPGNVIGVRVCAQFEKWEMHAHSGRLVVRVSNKGPRRPPSPSTNDWSSIRQEKNDMHKKIKDYLAGRNEGEHSTASIESDLLGKELRADLKYGAGERPLKLLSFDGGGVRGDPHARPCEYFDMMAGTSTGGLIAIMLGRLRMTVDQCIEAYESLASKIFAESIQHQVYDMANTGARYSASALESAIKEIVKKYTGDEDALMRDTSENPCKVFVAAVRADDISNHVATHLRTYTNPNVEKSFADYKIWEAARATSAAPTYFPRIKLGDYEYVDGGLGFNNPVLLLMGEARLYYGFAREFGFLLTFGTGMSPDVSLPPEGKNIFENIKETAGVMEATWEISSDSEQANQIAAMLVKSGHYYRFNVGERIAEKQWVEKVNPNIFEEWFGKHAREVDHFTPEDWANVTINLDDYKAMGTFVQLTEEYMKGEIPRLTECATKLPPKRSE